MVPDAWLLAIRWRRAGRAAIPVVVDGLDQVAFGTRRPAGAGHHADDSGPPGRLAEDPWSARPPGEDRQASSTAASSSRTADPGPDTRLIALLPRLRVSSASAPGGRRSTAAWKNWRNFAQDLLHLRLREAPFQQVVGDQRQVPGSPSGRSEMPSKSEPMPAWSTPATSTTWAMWSTSTSTAADGILR
jgi:hypothetical protein